MIDPATNLYHRLADSKANIDILRLIHDDLTTSSYLEIQRDLSLYRAVYNITTWPVASDQAIPIPVLYFNLYEMDDETGSMDLITDVNRVVELVVPDVYRSQIDSMPAISQGMHPVTGIPAFFVHPCKTEHWMSLMGSQDDIYYLWYQTFGQVVGL